MTTTARCAGESRASAASSGETVGEVAGRVPRGGHVDRRDVDLDRAAPAPAQLVEARVDGQTMEPAVELVGVPQPGQIAPGADAGVLHRVVGEVRVTDDQAGGTVEPGERGVQQLGEGDRVTFPCPLNERSMLHGVLRLRHDPSDVLEHYGVTQLRMVQIRDRCMRGRTGRVLAFETRLPDSDIA